MRTVPLPTRSRSRSRSAPPDPDPDLLHGRLLLKHRCCPRTASPRRRLSAAPAPPPLIGVASPRTGILIWIASPRRRWTPPPHLAMASTLPPLVSAASTPPPLVGAATAPPPLVGASFVPPPDVDATAPLRLAPHRARAISAACVFMSTLPLPCRSASPAQCPTSTSPLHATSPSLSNPQSESRREMVAQAPASVQPSTMTKGVEHENDWDVQEERPRVRVPLEVVAPMMSGMQRRDNTSVTSSGTRSPCMHPRQQIGHLLARVIEGREEEVSSSRLQPTMPTTISRSPFRRMMLSPRPRTQFMLSPRPRTELDASSSRLPMVPTTMTSRAMQEGQSPRPGTQQEEFDMSERQSQSSRKRKSPCLNMDIFRSPLSRMLLSPRLHLWVRFRSSSQGASSSTHVSGSQRGLAEIDLNAGPVWDDTDLNGDPDEQVNLILGLDHSEDDVNEGAPPQRRREVPKDTKKLIFDFLLAKAKSGELEGHEIGEASTKFLVNIRTVQRIWKDGKECLNQGTMVDFLSGKSKRGRKKKEVDLSKLRELPISSRGTLEDVSKELGIGKRKLHSLKKEGLIERVSNSIKPFLTENNKKERLKWCISMLDPRSIPVDPVFKDLFDFVFIDEKWFNITRKTLRYYKLLGEEQPTRTCKSTNFIPKIMILCAYSRLRFDSQANCTFDGKIGCFPFVFYEAAKRSSKNRRAGTIEMKRINSIKKGENREFLIDKVLPAIRAKWPREDANKPIYIQQDNAPSHIAPNDKLFCEAAKKDGFDIRLISQPPNSPDLNILDLGFFSSIQSIQYKTSSKTTEELVAAVQKAFDDYSPCKANRIFLTLHGCMKEVIKIGGGNNYNIPHIRKEMLERQGHLPVQLSCDAALVNEALAQIDE